MQRTSESETSSGSSRRGRPRKTLRKVKSGNDNDISNLISARSQELMPPPAAPTDARNDAMETEEPDRRWQQQQQQQQRSLTSVDCSEILAMSFMDEESVRRLENNREDWMDMQTLAGLFYGFARMSGKNVCVIHPYYVAALHQPALDGPELSARFSVYGNFDSYDVMLIPILVPGHWLMAAHERGNDRVVVYDSKLSRYDDAIEQRVLDAVRESRQNVGSVLELHYADRTIVNYQNDSHTCGFFSCLNAEQLLIGDGSVKCRAGLDIGQERERLLRLARSMCALHVEYERPDFIARGFREMMRSLSQEMEVMEIVGDEETTTDRQPEAPAREATAEEERSGDDATEARPRRSARLAGKRISVDRSRSSSTDGDGNVVSRCKRHRGLPCAAIDANHSPIYYRSGRIGDKVCRFCDALLLRSETSQLCCSDGKVVLPLRGDPPKYLQSLMNSAFQGSKKFIANIRRYNTLLAFGSLQVEHQQAPGRGPPVCLLNGQIQHSLSDLYAPPNCRPSFGNLYLLTTDEADAERQNNPVCTEANPPIDGNVLRALDVMLRENHPLAQMYASAHEQYTAALERSRQPGETGIVHFRLTLLNEWQVDPAVRDSKLHPRQVNRPTADSMFAIHLAYDSDGLPSGEPGVWLNERSTPGGKRLKYFHPCTDPAVYVLLFPRGEEGYHYGIPYANVRKSREFVSARQFYLYHFAIRGSIDTPPHASKCGVLTQSYVIDCSYKIEHQVADHVRKNQQRMHVDTLENIRKCLQNRIDRHYPGKNMQLGRVFLTSKIMTGSKKYMQEKYYDATAMFNQIGKPTFFVTSTFNSNWPEVAEGRGKCCPHLSSNDRVDVGCRIWMDKSKELTEDVVKREIFGPVKAYAQALEFQKRGGPHTHMLLCVDFKLTPAFVDQIVCAEIPPLPDKNDRSEYAESQRRLRETVIKYYIHFCTNVSLCQVDGRCIKNYPKPFADETVVFEDKPAIYRRRSPASGGEQVTVKIGNVQTVYDNRYVVEYNRYVTLKYGSHVNIRSVYGRHSAKYALKYNFKHEEAAYVELRQGRENSTGTVDYDEIAHHFKVNYKSPHQAYLHIASCPIVQMSHAVHKINLHKPGEAPVYYKEGEEDSARERVAQGRQKMSELEAWFARNATDAEARKYTLLEFPQHYVFNKDAGKWTKRVRKPKMGVAIGRIQPVAPSIPELFAIKQLVMHVRGPRNWTELCTVDGTPCRKLDGDVDAIGAAKRLGLLDDDEVWERTLAEGAKSKNPREMRTLFGQILLYGNPPNPNGLWQKFVDEMYDSRSVRGQAHRQRLIDGALYRLNAWLNRVGNGKCCADFGLPMPTAAPPSVEEETERNFFAIDFDEDGDGDEERERDERLRDGDARYEKLNAEQRAIVREIETALEIPAEQATEDRVFTVQGSGGTGKTFLYNTLVFRCIRRRQRVLPTATTGAAATLLFNGQTVHSAFKLGKEPSPQNLPSFRENGVVATMLKQVELIIVDEISMLHKTVLQCVDRVLRVLLPRTAHRMFAGKVVLLGGDWKQLLPVVPRGSVADQVNASVQSLYEYRHFRSFTLTENMRLRRDQRRYASFLEDVGRGRNTIVAERVGNVVRLPAEIVADTLDDVVRFVYDDVTDPKELRERLILAPLNDTVDEINAAVLRKREGESRVYLSADAPVKENPLAVYAADWDVEQLHELRPGNFPNHRLELKRNAIVMLMRNVDVRLGLCNGTRLLVEDMGQDVVKCLPLTGPAARRQISILIPRYRFEYEQEKQPDGSFLHFTRLQFPLRLAYAITINKAQGQTVSKVGVVLTTEVFGPGQLYVALSRVRSVEDIRIFHPTDVGENIADKELVKNVVARDLVF